jgi:hypothetical protein
LDERCFAKSRFNISPGARKLAAGITNLKVLVESHLLGCGEGVISK